MARNRDDSCCVAHVVTRSSKHSTTGSSDMATYLVRRWYQDAAGTLSSKEFKFGRDLERARTAFDNSNIGSPERGLRHLTVVRAEMFKNAKLIDVNAEG